MHLAYILEKNHFCIQSAEAVETARELVNSELNLGIKFLAGKNGHIRIESATNFPHIASGADDIGWFAKVSSKNRGKSHLSVTFVGETNSITKRYRIEPNGYTPIYLPSLLDLDDPFAPADLLITSDSASEISLFTSRRVERKALYRLAKGTGVEIGPGPKPQITNAPDVDVTYIEEKGSEDWLATYKTGASDSAWSTDSYKIGRAHDLPVEDESLDFIFSSHVFEHLYNPLGHLAHWHTKLRQGGLLLGVIPCLDGTKDFVLPPTTISQLVSEQATNSFDVPRSSIEKWVRHQQPRHKNAEAIVEKISKEQFSIHVHVYDIVLATTMFRYATDNLGFSLFRLHYKRNSKDFGFVLRK